MALTEAEFEILRRRVEGRVNSSPAAIAQKPPLKARSRPARVPGRMNKTEAAYAALLEARRAKGEVTRWLFEAITLKLGPDARYTPDFVVFMPDGTVEFHETKGFRRDDAMVKLRVAAGMFPEFTFRLIEKNGGREIKP